MPLPALLQNRLALPVIAAPMFLVSSPELVMAQCRAGIVGAIPALNARSSEILEGWLDQLGNLPAGSAPYAVNLILHPSNSRIEADLAICEQHRVPVIITSMSARADVVERVHAWGGIVLHDVVNARHAKKAVSQGVDGLILVAGGAGGHAGSLNPIGFVREIRRFFDGPLALGGAISDGAGILAAQALGADLAYMGTRFIATQEAQADADYKQMLLDAGASDILYTPNFSVAGASFLKASVERCGFHPETGLPLQPEKENAAAVWRDIWSAGQGVGVISDLPDVATLVTRLQTEYRAARAGLSLAAAAF